MSGRTATRTGEYMPGAKAVCASPALVPSVVGWTLAGFLR
jgi:hypothetical protein